MSETNLPLSCLGFFSGKGSTVCTADCVFSFDTDARISHLKPQSYQVEHQWFGPAHLSPDHSPYVLDFLWGKKPVLCMTRRQTRNCKQGFFKTKTETGTYTSSPSFVGMGCWFYSAAVQRLQALKSFLSTS